MERESAGAGGQASISLSGLCDRSLVEVAKGGAHEAYVELCARHMKMISHVVNRITKNREDAEDALQDALLNAYVYLQRFDGRSSFSTWLTRIAINSALMVLRRKRTRPEVQLEGEIDAGAWRGMWSADVSPTPERLYLDQEQERNLRRTVGRLPQSLREVLELQHAEDPSIKELAEMAGLSVAATKSRLLRARNTVTASMIRQNETRAARVQASVGIHV